MSELILWKDQEIRRLRRDMDRLFNRLTTGFGVPLFPGEALGGLFTDLSETKDTLTVKVEIPGIDPDRLNISVTDDRLTVSGEKGEENIGDSRYYHRVERRFGSFSRTIRLPCKVEIDDIEATYEKGILNIVMPKCKPEKKVGVKVQVR